jgi:tungstate transport system substrate-binding protein
MLLATTTSPEDSGLLPQLLAAWQAEGGAPPIHALIVGSGEALTLGRRGDADVLLVHAPEAEAAFMAGGHGVTRQPVMRNGYLIVGPAADPAGVATSTDAAGALARIAGVSASFISRGDDSGTHQRERGLWAAAGLRPWDQRGGWYIEAGQGMGETLRMAGELGAYTLTDAATYEVWRGQTGLVVHIRGGAELENPYSVIVPARSRKVAAARAFAEWLSGGPAQQLIADFGVERFGAPLFEPASAYTEGATGAAANVR